MDAAVTALAPADQQRWALALGAARKRWQSGRPAERARVQDELDALWLELKAGAGPSGDAAPVEVGPKHCNLTALVRYQDRA